MKRGRCARAVRPVSSSSSSSGDELSPDAAHASDMSLSIASDVSDLSGLSESAADFPPYIPQTMETALAEAQSALMYALSEGLRRVVVELPLGRIRKYWSTLAPIDVCYREAGILVGHFLQPFKTADIRVVYDPISGCSCPVTWIRECVSITCDLSSPLSADSFDDSSLVVFSGIQSQHSQIIHDLLNTCLPPHVPVLLLNCFLDMPFNRHLYVPSFNVPTSIVYFCRARNHTCVSRYGHLSPWHIFVEIAAFEYEWIQDIIPKDDCDTSNILDIPSEEVVSLMARQNNCLPRGRSVFYSSVASGREAGFFPFMTLAAKYITPLDGNTYRDVLDPGYRKRKNRANTPFGFF